VAPRSDKDSRLRGRGSLADPFTIDHEKSGDKASGVVGTIFAASLLRAPFILLRRSHSHGQCVNAEWMATICTLERDTYRDVNHSEDFLEERGQEREAGKDTNALRIEVAWCGHLASVTEPSGRGLGRTRIDRTQR